MLSGGMAYFGSFAVVVGVVKVSIGKLNLQLYQLYVFLMNRQYPTYLNFIDRKMLLQLLWDQEENIDESFRKFIKIKMDDQYVNISMMTTQC
jgi:hypothetical protein